MVGDNLALLSNGMVDLVSRGNMTAIADRNTRESLLLRLPAEIRNQIFEAVLRISAVLIWHQPFYNTHRLRIYKFRGKDQSDEYVGYRKSTQIPFNLLLVSRQIYAETALLPFTLNTFAIESSYQIMSFKNKILPAQFAAITKCALPSAGSPWLPMEPDFLTLVSQFRNLVKVEIGTEGNEESEEHRKKMERIKESWQDVLGEKLEVVFF